MHIVALDAYTLNPGDLSWQAVAESGSFVHYPRSTPDEVLLRAKDADIVITNKVPFNADRIATLPRLKMIAVTATGYNIIDTIAAKARGIKVCNVPAYSGPSVAQHVFALLLELTNHVGLHNETVHAGEWSGAPDFSYCNAPMVELAGKTMGIVGLGHIGQRVGAIAHGFGMNVAALQRRASLPDVGYPVTGKSMEALFAESDVVSLHCPLTPDNARFVNAALLSRMKTSAFLINTARGGLVHETDLIAALRDKRLAGYGTDVLAVEPPPASDPLLSAPRVIITPHNAWATIECRRRCMAITARNIAAFVAGQSENVVNP